jgi:hypothetical protein
VKEISVHELVQKASELERDGKRWHFHILTPECQLNETDKYALVLENTSDDEAFVCYSDEPYMDIGKELVKLLHGDDVVADDYKDGQLSDPSEQIRIVLSRAKKLNESGESWHHHMLFPGCRFNNSNSKWALIFEEKGASEVIESISEDEPKNDLQHIEKLFYQQRKAG